jgi:hypothetical protein
MNPAELAQLPAVDCDAIAAILEARTKGNYEKQN